MSNRCLHAPATPDAARGPTRMRVRLPERLNAVLLGVAAFASASALFAAPRLGAAPAAVPLLVLAAPLHWGLIHEAIHGHLFAEAARNRAAGRGMAVLLGVAFDLVRFGHLMHHAETGHEFDRPDRPQPGEARWRTRLRHYAHLLGGHYALTAGAGALPFLPWAAGRRMVERNLPGDGAGTAALRDATLRWFAVPRRRASARADVGAALALLAASALAFGAAWPWLLAGLLGRGAALSLLDNMPHYGTAGAGDVRQFRAPRWLAALVLNHHLHRTHHSAPHLPWTAVPAEAERTGGAAGGSHYAAGVLRQFRGPNWA